jgi:signal transduction histidine kinase
LTQDPFSKVLLSPLALSERWIELRIISAMRIALAFSALLVIYVDPPEPDRLVVPTYLALTAYLIYSTLLYLLVVRRSRILPVSILHWLDVGWYLLLISLSSGTNSVFFVFFFYAILVASFGWGFSSGLRVTIVSAVLFTAIGFATAPAEPEFQVNRLLLRPLELLVLGYLIAYWGGLQSRLKGRLRLLKEVSLVSNPRFGVERTIHSVLESLRSAYAADTGMLILLKAQAGQPIRLYGSSSEGPYSLYRVDGSSEESKYSTSEIEEETARRFLLASPSLAVIYRKGKPRETLLYDITSGRLTKADTKNMAFFNAFEGKSYFSVPASYRSQHIGRLFIAGSPYRFDYADIDFMIQAMEQVTGVLENIRLVDNLASDAAGEERRKIAQDIHDSVIQPYIGLQFGLTSVKQKLQNGEDARDNVEELLALTNGEIADLRRYVGGLRRGETPRDIFLPAVRRFAAKFSEATGLNVEINGRDDLPVYDRLAAELFQMIEEGLSNIRRHSTSTYAKLNIEIKDGNLEMSLRNERLKRLGEASFTPRSIAERSAALGGRTTVYTDMNHDTVVRVQIPL